MGRISRKQRRLIATFIWLFGICLSAGLGYWSYKENSRDAEHRLIGEAARTAGELAGYLSYSKNYNDPVFAHAIASGALEDERVYAVKITVDGQMIEGFRRNYQWEPVPWDDEIAESSIQGMNPVKMYEKPVGKVEVWISTRAAREEKALIASRELTRFYLFAFLWTLALILLLWMWGDIRRFLAKFRSHQQESAEADNIILKLGREQAEPESAAVSEKAEKEEVINPRAGRRHQHNEPDAWFVTAGMFRQTFGNCPVLMNRLYADGEVAGLCHLGRMLELAAPCIGAQRLSQSAKEMQKKLNNPEAMDEALAVENCVLALEEVLQALHGNAQWQKPEGARS